MKAKWNFHGGASGRRTSAERGRREARRARTLMAIESLESRTMLTATPVADLYHVLENQAFQAVAPGVLGNDVNASGNPLTVTGNTQPAHGTVALGADGSFTYTPTPGYVGPDSFQYTISDGLGGVGTGAVTLDVVGATATRASITAGPRLASVDSTRGALLNAVLGGLLGTSLNVNALDWNGLAQGNVNALDFLNALQTELGVGSTSQALTTDATLFQVISAAADAATAGGDTATATILDGLALDVSGLTAPIRVGDILQVDPNTDDLAQVDLNALDLVTGGVQLFNFDNVLATPTPVSISGASLGLAGLLNNVSLSAVVVEPPVQVVGPAGTSFHTAATRLRLDLDLIDTGLDTSGLLAALGGLGLVTATASVGQLSLYVEVAGGTGSLTMIDAVSNAVTIQGTPGVADLFLGTVSDAAFTNRSIAITPADVTPGVVGNLGIRVAVPIIGTVLADVNVGITASSSALGQAPLVGSLVYNGPFPQTQTFGSSAASVSNLLSTLVGNLTLGVSGTLGPLLNPLLGTVLGVLKPLVTGVVSPALGTVLTGVVDPLLGTLGIGIGEMDVTVEPLIPDASPLANPDFAQTPEDAAVAIPVLGNDASSPAGTATLVSTTQPANGTVAINANGTITYTPNANFNGTDTFTYTITDPNGGTSTATVSVLVLSVNDVPVANPDAYGLSEDQVLMVAGPGVLANDVDGDGDPLTAALVTGPANGTLVLNPNGSFTYTPNANFNGTDSFTYTASDGVSTSLPVTVTLTIAAVADAPLAAADAYTIAEDTPLTTTAATGVLANDTDADGDPLTALLVAGPANGTLVLNANGSFTYTPNANFNGVDTFTYQAFDGALLSAVTTVTLNVTAVNDAPVANPDAYTIPEDAVLTTTALNGVLANDTDADGDPLTVALGTGPANGTLVLNPNGSFTYTPNANFNGTDTFTYTASDGVATTAPVTVTITVSAVEDAPVALPDAYAATEDTPLVVPVGTGVLANDTDGDGDPLTAVLVSGPANGTLVLNPNGSFTYTPNANYNGPDSFVYQASDGVLLSAPVTVTIGVAAVNDVPVANPDAYTIPEDAVLTTTALNGVLANDTDADGDPLTVALGTGPANGTLVLNPNGSFTYTPNANFNGTDTFTYTASDGVATTAPVTVTISVTAVADAPVANPDAYTATEDTPLVVPVATGVLANDTDADGDVLTALLVTGPANGTLVLNPNGSFTYTPNANYNGPDSFVYRASDGTLLSAPVTVTIGVTAVNDVPVANPDAYGVIANSPLTATALTGVLANDTDADGDPLTAAVGTGPANGTLVLNPNGSFTYTPNIGFVGTDTFTYTASDGTATSAAATVTITVSAIPNTPPVANPDAYTATEDTPLVVPVGTGVLANDTDVDGNPLTAVLVTGPTNGTLTLNPNGSFTYTPSANYNGPDSFVYQASDGVSQSAPVTVTIGVTAVNDAPVALPDAYTVAEDTPLVIAVPGVLANDTDVDGDPLTAAVATLPTNGTLVLNLNGSFTYTPNPNFNGTDTFTYTASDGVATTAPVTVTITVTAVADAPVANPDAYTATEDTPLVVPVATGVLANDTDADGDVLTAVLVSGPANGTLVLNLNGSFTYTPNANYNGPDSFVYQASDGALLSAPVTVTIGVTAVNDAPVANPDAYTIPEDAVLTTTALNGVLANDVDPDGDPLTVALGTGPANGTLVLNPNGSFTYTPSPNFNGTDTFTYTASDGVATTAPVTVTITVNAVADAPVALPDAYAATEDTPLVVPVATGVLANDTDGDGDPLTAVLVSGPANGTLVLNPNGSFTYTPNANYNGPDSFVYQASDGVLLSAPVTVTIGVAAVNDVPVANPDAYSIPEDGALTVPAATGVLANDVDPDGDPLTAALATGPANGTLVLNPNGSFTYTPNANFNGVDTFTYTASDGVATTAPITVTITVSAVEDAPVANPDAYTATEDTPLVVPVGTGVLANDTDADGDELTAVLISGPANGTLAMNPNGSFTYTPAPNFNGTDTFIYQAFDGTLLSAPITVTIAVTAVNDAPVANPDAYTMDEDGVLTVPPRGVLANDVDVDGDVLTSGLVTGPTNGTLVFNADGSFTYTPNANFNGTDTFTYQAFDGILPSAPVTVTITVNAVNDAPLGAPDSYTTAEDTVLTVPAATGVLANDSDVEGTPLGAALISGPANGVLTFNSDGSFTYTPNANFNGFDSFVYVASDGVAFSSPITVTIGVTAVNDAPIANPDAYTMDEDGVLTVPAAIGVLANDTDPDGDVLSSGLFSGPSNGTLVLNGDGSFTYTPNANFNGTDSFSYMAFDGILPTAPVTVTITVNAVNDAPVANPDSYTTAEDTVLTVPVGTGVLANDTDVEGTPLGAAIISGPTNGTLAFNSNGSFVYTPRANFHGTDSFVYAAGDGLALSNPVTVTITVTSVPDAPVANPDAYTMDEDGVLLVPAATGVLANDTDGDGDVLSSGLSSGPAHGTLVLNGDGSFTYTPNANFNGTDSFSYMAFDGTTATAPVTVTITVNAVNDAPVANPDAYTVNEDTVLTVPAATGVLANDTDVEGTPLGAALISGPRHGTLALNPDGSFTYRPNPNFNGTDSFVYVAGDGVNLSAPVTVTFSVSPVNDMPVGVPDSYTVNEDGVLVVSAANGVLANDIDPDDEPLTTGQAAGSPAATVTPNGDGSFTFNQSGLVLISDITTNPTHGTLALNGDGSFTYRPDANFNGVDSFTYRAQDADDLTPPVTVTIRVLPVDDSPVASPDANSVNEDGVLTVPPPSGVLANDSDIDSTTLTAVLVSGPSHGTLNLNADGSFTYVPAPDYFGPDSFVYRPNDGQVLGDPVNVAITVNPMADKPIGGPDVYEVPEGGIVVPGPGVLINDRDPDGRPLTATLVNGPSNGVLTFNPDGSFRFVPNPGYVGPDSFTYRATNGEVSSDPVTVTFAVDGALAQVQAVQRYGFHHEPTLVVLRFSAPLDPARAQNPANYEVLGPGRDGRFGTRDDVRYAVSSATYDPATNSVTLAFPQLLLLRSTYRVTILSGGATGLTTVGGSAIDGDRDGLPGGDAHVTFDGSSVAGQSSGPRTPAPPRRVVIPTRPQPRPAVGPKVVAPRGRINPAALDALLASQAGARLASRPRQGHRP